MRGLGAAARGHLLALEHADNISASGGPANSLHARVSSGRGDHRCFSNHERAASLPGSHPRACRGGWQRRTDLARAEATAALQQLQDTTKHNGFRKRIATALTVAATASGLTPGQTAERTVPTAGLSDHGTVDIVAGTLTARASVDDDLRVRIAWAPASGWAAESTPTRPKLTCKLSGGR